jgi:proteic killer suppression protein
MPGLAFHGAAELIGNAGDFARHIKVPSVPPANRLEKLRGKWQGFYGIRVNEQYRIVFRFEASRCSAAQCDYH